MKKLLLMTLMVVMIMTLIACGNDTAATGDATGEAAAPAVQFITAEEAHEKLGDDNYQFLDVRQLEDYQAGHIEGSIHADMHKANKEGDIEDGKTQMQNAGVVELDKDLVLVCYSGKSYAEAATKVLGELGYDASRIYTLEGGMKEWEAKYPEEKVQ